MKGILEFPQSSILPKNTVINCGYLILLGQLHLLVLIYTKKQPPNQQINANQNTNAPVVQTPIQNKIHALVW